jgi:hypothetical protein
MERYTKCGYKQGIRHCVRRLKGMDLVTPFLAGAAGALVKQLADKGIDWLIQLVGSHSPAVQAQAQINLQNFLYRLAKRVEQLEAELPTAQRGVFEDALSHPGSSLLMQKAMISAAVTENDDRHTILSELIAQRLTAGANDMIALVGTASCDVVNALSSKHIRLLGLIARLFSVRPLHPPEITDQNQYDQYVTSWWGPLDELCKGIEDTNNLDLQHLVGLSCISVSISSKNLTALLTLPVKPVEMKPTMAQFEAFSWWQNFHKIWDVGLEHVTPTSVGTLIGILYHDSHLRSRTQIDWK